jgi:hypothetical protein
MPRGDGTGPVGLGPMTGRAAGYCAGFGVPGYVSFAPGRGFGGRGGRRGGGGRGWRNRFYAAGLTGWQRAGLDWPGRGGPWAYAGADGSPFAPAMPREQEAEFFRGQVEYLEDALEGLRKRLEEIEAKAQKA